MTKRAQLPDGRILEFPDDTPDAVVQRVVKEQLGIAPPAPAPAPAPAPTPAPVAASPKERPGFLDYLQSRTTDYVTRTLKGALGGVEMGTNLFGADNPVSEILRGAQEGINEYLVSDTAKQAAEERSKRLEGKGFFGTLAEVPGIVADDPALLAEVLGTALPSIGAAALTGGSSVGVQGAAMLGTGAAMGAGAIKGSIYTTTKEELLKTGRFTKEEAEQAASEAQSYAGENLDMIALGTALGAIASRTGMEPTAARLLAGRIVGKSVGQTAGREALETALLQGAQKGAVRTATEEAVLEGAQGAQEKFATNLALQRQGMDVDLMEGVGSAAALEGTLGGALGGGLGLAGRGVPAEAAPEAYRADSPQVEQEYLRLVTAEAQALRDQDPNLTQRQAFDRAMKDAGRLYDTALTNILFGAEGEADVAADVDTAVDVSGGGGAGAAPDLGAAPPVAGAPDLGEAVAGRLGEPLPSVPVPDVGAGAGVAPLAPVAPAFDIAPIMEAPTLKERTSAARQIVSDIAIATPELQALPKGKYNQAATQMAKSAARGEQFDPVDVVYSVAGIERPAPVAPAPTPVPAPEVPAAPSVDEVAVAPVKAAIEAATTPAPPAPGAVPSLAQASAREVGITPEVAAPEVAAPEVAAPPAPSTITPEAAPTAVGEELAARDQEVSAEMLAPEAQVEPTVAETAAPEPFTATPAKAEPTAENYTGPLSDWTPKLFRETSMDQLELFLPTGSRAADMRPELFMADTPDLALGQGGNEGVLLEFDAKPLQGQLSKAKPTWEFGLTEGTGSEFIASRNQQSAYKKALSAVRIAKDAKITKVQKDRLDRVLKELEASGWTRTDADNYTQYTRPAPTAPTEAAPTPAAAAATPPGAPPVPPAPPAATGGPGGPAPKKPQVISNGKPVVLTEAQTRTAVAKAKAAREKMNRIQKRIAATNDTADVLSDGIELVKLARGDAENWALLRGAVDTLDVGKWKLMLPVLSTEDIFRILKGRLPGLVDADRIVRQDMVRFQTKEYLQLAEQLEKVAEFLKKYPKAAQALSDLQFATVAYQVDPTKADNAEAYFNKVDGQAKEIRAKIKAEKDAKKRGRLETKLKQRLDDIKSVYDGVPGGERVIGWRDLARPEFGGNKGKEIFKLLRDGHRRDLEVKYNALRSRLMESKEDEALDEALEKLEAQFKPALDQVIYFPAMRFGSYYARVGSGADSIFKMFETEKKRNQFVRVMEARGEGITDVGNVEDLRNNFQQVTGGPLKEVLDLFDGNPKDIGALKNQVFDLWLQTMSQGDMRKHMAPRKMRAGYSTDILKNFANFRRSSINDVKRAQFGYKMRTEISRAKDMVKDMPDRLKMNEFIKEIELRTLSNLMPPDRSNSVWESAIEAGNKMAFYQYLANPKTAAVQLTQLHAVALPMLAQKYGHVGAVTALAKYGFSGLGGFAASPLTSIKKEDGSYSFNWEQPNLLDNPVSALKQESDPELYEVLSEGWNEGRDLNLYMDTFANEIGGYGEADPEQRSALQELMRGRVDRASLRGAVFAFEAMGSLMHQMERVNREATYMAALELGYRENRKKGQDHAEAKKNAIDDAVETTLAATFDFSSYNKPRILTTGVGRVAGQFMSYPYFLSSLFVRKMYTAIKFGPLEPGERLAAAEIATGSMVNLGLYAGLTGLPLYGFFTAIASMLLWLFDDDDDEEGGLSYVDEDGNIKATYNVDWWFRNVWIPKFFGPDGTAQNLFGYDDETAEIVARSVEKGPISAITDVDLSNSVALDFMFFVPKEPRFAETPQEKVVEYTFAGLTGGFGSAVMDYLKAGQDLMNGYTDRALERLPKLFGNVAKANRFATEGQLNYNRELVGMNKDFWTSDKAILQALGFASTEASQRQQQNYEGRSIRADVQRAREDFLNKLRKVALDKYQYGDTPEVREAEQKIREDWVKFNNTYPTDVIGVDSFYEVQVNAVNDAIMSQATRGLPMDEKGVKTPYLRDLYLRRLQEEEQ